MGDVGEDVYHAMDEVIPGLWVGDVSAAVANDELEANNIKFILSAMRGRVKINPMLRRHQIPLDDSRDADVLKHIPACNALLEAALSRGDGVLVHCQAGMSRSVTIVAAFLMYSKKMDRDSAIKLIQLARPSVGPNEGFMQQLELYHSVSFKISERDRNIRQFYLDRSVKEILNGDGSEVRSDMFAGFPRSPTASTPATPGGGPRRRIRCKMCRRELAAREHMMDHGQLSPPTPKERSRAPSWASSLGEGTRGSRNAILAGLKMSVMDTGTPGDEKSNPVSRRPSRSGSQGEHAMQSVFGGLAMTSLSNQRRDSTNSNSNPNTRHPSHGPSTRPSFGEGSRTRSAPFSSLMMSSASESAFADSDSDDGETEITTADAASPGDASADSQQEQEESGPSTEPLPEGPVLLSPGEISAQLPTSVSALRRSSLIAALQNSSPYRSLRDSLIAQPIISNPACSGYFIEPMKWMDPQLGEGMMAGKISCPNEKCNAKLGSYDWAGIQCGCSCWVTPGFVIARAKVDEVS